MLLLQGPLPKLVSTPSKRQMLQDVWCQSYPDVLCHPTGGSKCPNGLLCLEEHQPGRAPTLLRMQTTLHQGQELTCCTALLETASFITDLTLHGRLPLPGISPLRIQGFQNGGSLGTTCHLSLQGSEGE